MFGLSASTAGSARAQTPVPAGFGIRALAYLVDASLLSLVGGAFPYLVINASSTAGPGQHAATSGTGSILVSLIYFVVFWSTIGGGRTLGMRLFGLRVVTEQDLAPPGVMSALLRWIGLWVSFALCFLGVIWVAFDPRHQGWHDKIAKTLVVRS
ncbi:MAG: RDD family protein [Chloroflexi bacterium]|nr:MAG: RDD family protein [Chloroflexota bacterium]TME04274.1 MAG: RDD family protein [Chloroflexota bacterium]